MTLSPPQKLGLEASRWHVITRSQYTHEQEGLDTLRQACDPRVVLEAWTNFEFLDEQGKLYEVDALLLTVYGLLLVELKHFSGDIVVNELVFIRRRAPGAPATSEPSPLRNTNHKARVLGGRLRKLANITHRDPGFVVDPVVFLSHPNVRLRFENAQLRQPIVDPQNVAGFINSKPPGRQPLLKPVLEQARKALEELGVRQGKRREFRVGDYLLQALLGEGPNYQDFLAQHTSLSSVKVRVRTFVGKDQLERKRAQRAAEREFRLLADLRHDHILSPREYKEWELGPALIYPYYEDASVLNVLLANEEASAALGFLERLRLWAQIGEALRYAHQRRIYHRSLAPQNVLVLDRKDVKIINWQTASASEQTTGTVHLAEWVEEEATAYLAPEMLTSPNEADASADLFSLGCLGFFLFGGQPPAFSQSELHDKLLEGQGLQLLSVMDHAPAPLVSLIQELTHPVHHFRTESAEAFLRAVTEIERDWQLLQQPGEQLVDPLEAAVGERVLPDFTLVRKLGQGSTSAAFLVTDGHQELVLKVALRRDREELLRAEAEVLQKLNHRKIVSLKGVIETGVRPGLLLTSAGPETLAERLAREQYIGLEFLQRWGDDLLECVEELERQGLAHRDIKPANLGVAELTAKGQKHLVLFDFSLSREDRRRVEVGTPGYRDPFLHTTRRPWDEAAERYAAAVTLYEMATGKLPQWGDGRTNPATAPIEVEFGPADFDPSLRDRFEAFFRKAFQREASARFESARAMREAWQALFTGAAMEEQPTSVEMPDSVPSTKPLLELTNNPQLLQVFDRLNLQTAGALAGVQRSTLVRLSNVGGATRRLLKDFYDLLAQRLEGEALPYQQAPAQALESLWKGLLPKEGAALIQTYLSGTPEIEWPTPGEAARVTRFKGDPNKVTVQARRKWGDLGELAQLRDALEAQLEELGGVATVEELSDALLSLRGSLLNTRAERRAVARAVLRAALEVEDMQSLPRFALYRLGRQPVVATEAHLAEALWQAARKADELVQLDPLPSNARVQRELQAQCPWTETAEGRFLRLVTALAESARLSSRGELYPAGMPPRQTLQLTGSLLSGKTLKPDRIQELVSARYPESAALPKQVDELEAMMRELRIALRWDEQHSEFRSTYGTTQHTGRSSSILVGGTGDAAEFERRLAEAHRGGDAQVIQVQGRELAIAETWLCERFGLQLVSLEQRLIREMLAIAARDGIPESDLWLVDREGPALVEDWRGLLEVAAEAARTVVEELSHQGGGLLLKRLGLWARYGLLGQIATLLERSGRPGGPPVVWLLAPASEGLPTIDDQPVPLPAGTRPLAWPGRFALGVSA